MELKYGAYVGLDTHKDTMAVAIAEQALQALRGQQPGDVDEALDQYP